jgi:rhodanese-related sulfurtransferase
MQTHAKTTIATLCASLLLGPALLVAPPAQSADAPAAATAPSAPSHYPKRVDVNFVKPYAVMPKPDGVTIVDARPAARKYDVGHIPTAVNIPDSQFDKLAPGLLPKDKSQLVIFYCDGPECMLSHNSAFKAEKLGYTNIRVYADGYPDWIKNGNPHASVVGAAPAPAIVAGKEAGSIEIASFERIFKEAPGTVHLIDVREPQEFASGTFKGAINMPINTLEKNIAQLPADKPIVFFCGAGGRSGEAHDMVKMYRPELKTVFLDATIKWTAAGQYTIAGK